MWLLFSAVALVVLPSTLALLLVRHLWSVYARVPLSQWIIPLLFGFGWGLAQALFGLTIARLGLALGYAIVMGFVSVLGTLVPLLAQPHARNKSNSLAVSGIVIMAAGVAALGWAGRLREKSANLKQPPIGPKITFRSAIVLAIACGVFAPMLNYSFAFAEPIRSAAVASGTPRALAGYAVWPITLTAGFLPNLLYCCYLLRKNRSWKLFRSGSRDLGLATAMGVLWMGSLSLYGMCAALLGDLGTSLGWGIVQALTILAAAALGSFTHEWAGVSSTTSHIRSAGLALLVLATFLMALGTVLRT